MDGGPQGNAGLVTEARGRYAVPRGPMGAMKDVEQDALSKTPRPQLPSVLHRSPDFPSTAPGLTSADLESVQPILMDIIFD